MKAYVHEVGTRKVDDLVAPLVIDAGVSKPEVSRICAEFDAVVAMTAPSGRPSCAAPWARGLGCAW